jgi:[ribosomal protein S5]-alanine N-acetyltransferase
VEPIPGREVFLRRPEAEDMDLVLRLLNDPAVTSSTVEVGMPVSSQQNMAFHRDGARPDAVHLAVVERASMQAVGVTVIQKIDWRTQTAEHGMKMDPQSVGRGLATDACMARNTFLFFRLGLRRLVWKSLDFNIASQRLALRLGYRLEGREREAVQRDGRWCDILIYGLLRREAEEMDAYREYRRLVVPVDYQASAVDSAAR